MPDGNETQETKINRNVEALRQAFEPLTAGLTPDVEPASIYLLQSMIPATKTSHDG
jgi:hypothetical protein